MDSLALTFTNWRLFPNTQVTITHTNTLIVGENGAGKTTVLAGVYALFTGEAWPGTTWRQQIKTGEQYFGISSSDVPDWFVTGLISPQGRVITRYGNEIPSGLSYTPITYLPDDNRWLVLSRSAKLALIDQALIAIHGKLYSDPLRLLEKNVTSKNRFIKKVQESGGEDQVLIEELHSEIERLSYILWDYRKTFLLEFRIALVEFGGWIDSKIDSVKLKYIVASGNYKLNAFEDVELPNYKFVWHKELSAGRVLYGAQRDDIMIDMNGQNAEVFLSRGENRALTIFFKRFVRSKLSTRVLWLLDDFFNEFDEDREQKVLSQLVQEGDWIIATSTRHVDGFSNYLEIQ